ncbi:hypothetical protein VTN00DRAFT_6878 [Thermoascus crustaceus]|uniref:uncharacterized protein n=1 Tax=Thermoascus crustaceus TaxID=5088 RepID=UPI003742701F
MGDSTEKEYKIMKNDECTAVASPVDGSSIEKGNVAADTKGDEALQFASRQAIRIDAETGSRILCKIDLHILPWMFGLTGSIFYIGYLAFEYPHNVLMQKFLLARYVSVTVVFWEIVLCCHAGTNNFAGLMATRFFLGALEGSVTAGQRHSIHKTTRPANSKQDFFLITSRWYRGSEQAFRTAIGFCANGFSQIAGGAFAYGIARGFRENVSITFPSWKAIFLVCGLLTSLYGFGLLYFLPDSPINARWLSREERRLAVERLRANQQGIGSRVLKWYQVREAFTDIRGGVVQIITNLGFPYIAHRTQNRMASASGAMLLGLFGISLMAGLAREGSNAHRIGQLVGYYIVIGNSATALLLIFSSVGTNVAGYTKKTTINAITMIGYCVGFLIGPSDIPSRTTLRQRQIQHHRAVDRLAVLPSSSLWINSRENARRDKRASDLPPQPAGQEFLDLTDKENPYFSPKPGGV